MSKRLREDAERYLQAQFPRMPLKKPKACASVVKAHAQTPGTNAEKVKLLSLAYALSVRYGADSGVLNALLAGRGRKHGLRDPIRIFVEALYDLGVENSETRTKSLSRWTTAIRHLGARKVPPSQVVNLSSARGEGINAWSRSSAKRRSVEGRRRQAPQSGDEERSAKVIMIRAGIRRYWEVNRTDVLSRVIDDLDALAAAYPVISKRDKS